MCLSPQQPAMSPQASAVTPRGELSERLFRRPLLRSASLSSSSSPHRPLPLLGTAAHTGGIYTLLSDKAVLFLSPLACPATQRRLPLAASQLRRSSRREPKH